jgi:hypothetical protein
VLNGDDEESDTPSLKLVAAIMTSILQASLTALLVVIQPTS